MNFETSIADSLDGRYWLTHGVARAAGVSLPELVARGVLDRDALRNMIARCAGCTKTDTCLLHLAVSEDPDAAVPPYCLNRETIETLKCRR